MITSYPLTLKNGRVIADEVCTCGHRQNQHGPSQQGATRGLVVNGHGGCIDLNCNCEQFSWGGFVYQDGTIGG